MRHWCLVAAIAIAVAFGQTALSAQKQQQIFISLTAPDGTPVSGLEASDVGVSEDDVACKVVKVEPIDWPLKIVPSSRARTAVTVTRNSPRAVRGPKNLVG